MIDRLYLMPHQLLQVEMMRDCAIVHAWCDCGVDKACGVIWPCDHHRMTIGRCYADSQLSYIPSSSFDDISFRSIVPLSRPPAPAFR